MDKNIIEVIEKRENEIKKLEEEINKSKTERLNLKYKKGYLHYLNCKDLHEEAKKDKLHQIFKDKLKDNGLKARKILKNYKKRANPKLEKKEILECHTKKIKRAKEYLNDLNNMEF